MKNKGLIIALISFLSIISIFLIIIMILLLNGKIKIPRFNISTKVSEELILDKNYDDIFSEIIIKSSTSDINIFSSDDKIIRVVIYGDKSLLNIKDTSNILDIAFEGKKCSLFCFNLVKNRIDIYLPSGYDKDIFINNDYGDIEIGDLKKANIKIEEDCGDVYIKNGNEVIVNNDYGDIKIDNATDIDVNNSAGDIKIGTVNKAKIKNNYGDIIVRSINEKLDITDDCGDIKISNLELKQNSYIKNNFGDIKIGSTNKIYIDAKTDLGNVKINSNFNKSDITLKLDNDCGDIKVDN